MASCLQLAIKPNMINSLIVMDKDNIYSLLENKEDKALIAVVND